MNLMNMKQCIKIIVMDRQNEKKNSTICSDGAKKTITVISVFRFTHVISKGKSKM